MAVTAKIQEKWSDFHGQFVRDERRHQFYSRALAWVIAVLLVAIGVLGWVAGSSEAAEHPDCRQTGAGALTQALAPLALELARTPQQVRSVLRGSDAVPYPSTPAYTEAMCVEARAARHRRLLTLDSALFIPLYAMLGLAATAWYITLAMRARGPAWTQGGELPRRLIALAWLSAACLTAAAVLDARENRAVHDVINQALGAGAFSASALSEWAATVNAARHASLDKWLASAAWAATLAALAALQRASLSSPRGSARRQRASAAVACLLLVTGLLAALALGAGALWGRWAPSNSSDPWVVHLLSLGLLTLLVQGVLLLALHALNLPPRLRLRDNATTGMPDEIEQPDRLVSPAPP